MPTVNPDLLKVFEEISFEGGWSGSSANSWNRHYTFLASLDPGLLEKRLDRADLFALRGDSKVSIRDLCALIFVWGGMNRSHAEKLFQAADAGWLDVAVKLRNGAIDAHEGYERFYQLSRDKKMPGCGPAYYTKLLFFLPPPEKRGVIMDQWTARSINYLTGSETIKMDVSHVVSPKKNSAKEYRVFCDLVTELAQAVYGNPHPDSVEKIEMRMFSEGGREKDPWRELISEGGSSSSRSQENVLGYSIILEQDGRRSCDAKIFGTLDAAKSSLSAQAKTEAAVGIAKIVQVV